MHEAILVLGARIKPPSEAARRAHEEETGIADYRGPLPGAVLASRCEKALELARGTDATVVVSGRGEARAMAWWLFSHGLDPARILLEYDATSTNENLENAARLVPGAHLTVVTSDFHKLRTLAWAWHLGIPATVVSSLTPSPFRQRAFLREVFALPHSLLRIAYRRLKHSLA